MGSLHKSFGFNSKRHLNTRQTVGYGIPSSLLALRVDLRGLRSKLSSIRHVLLWYTWSAGAFAFTQTALFAQIGDSNDKCCSSFEVEFWNEDETHAVQKSPTQF